jgi:DNA replication protein DnaC
LSAACPDNRCDGSGFVYDEQRRRARACSCRPRRLARKRAAAVAGRLPKRFRGVAFDREPVLSIARHAPHVVREVRRYTGSISANLAEGRGLAFAGDVGTGKTTLAMLVAKAALEADHTVAIYSLPRLLATLRDTYDDNAAHTLSDLVERLCTVELLHVDDVGAEQSSAWVLEQLYTIVNTRYEDSGAMVFTTNLDDRALREQIGDRTVSRLYEMCGTPLPMYGDDMRSNEGVLAIPDPTPAAPDPWDDTAWDREDGAAPSYGRPRAPRERPPLD